jgi:hypothetical protein
MHELETGWTISPAPREVLVIFSANLVVGIRSIIAIIYG